jgi:hypothetical protein
MIAKIRTTEADDCQWEDRSPAGIDRAAASDAVSLQATPPAWIHDCVSAQPRSRQELPRRQFEYALFI